MDSREYKPPRPPGPAARRREIKFPIRQLCDELGIGDEAKASNMGITVRRRFKVALRRRVREFVDSDEKVDQEIRELMEILSKGGAGG